MDKLKHMLPASKNEYLAHVRLNDHRLENLMIVPRAFF
jgi:hypothetical protein